MVTKETIGKVQLVIGILLLVGSILSGIYLGENYQKEFDLNSGNFIDGVKDLQNQNFTNEDSKYIISFEIAQQYTLNDNYLKFRLTILESTSLIIFILSLLFITQGLVNIKQVNR
jgi:hypothetical protein